MRVYTIPIFGVAVSILLETCRGELSYYMFNSWVEA